MRVTFLNVGQGDSLILQWQRDNEDKIGIIDCKEHNNINLTIEHIKLIRPKRIDFILMSHPHSDHYSGLKNLIEFLIREDIPIDHFFTTASVSPNRIRMAVKGKVAKNEVSLLFSMINNYYEAGLLETYLFNETGIDLPLNKEWSLKIMSPSTQELNDYSSKAKYEIITQEEESENEPYANLLSSFLAIYNNESYCLLTSDSVNNTFHRIDKKYRDFFNKKTMSLGQIAHHGSSYNYKPIFWKNKNLKSDPIPIVISVGKNNYNHPSEEVLESLAKLGFSTYTTESLTNLKDELKIKISLLDVFSTPTKSNSPPTSLTFELLTNKAIKI